MVKGNNLQTKSYEIAVKVTGLYRQLPKEQQAFLPFRQLLKSTLSVGAKLQSVSVNDSRSDLLTQLHSSQKELKEAQYLLRLLKDTDCLDSEVFKCLLVACQELSEALSIVARKIKRFPF